MSTDVSVGDRLIAGVLSALIMAVMALVVPVSLAVLSRGRGLELLGVFGTFHVWGMAVVVFAGVVGLVLGSARVAVLFGHLWGTEQPRRIGVTLSLWGTLLLVAFISNSLFG